MKLIRTLAVCLLVVSGAVGSPANSLANSAAPIPSVGGGEGGGVAVALAIYLTLATTCTVVLVPTVVAIEPFREEDDPELGSAVKDTVKICWPPIKQSHEVTTPPAVRWRCPRDNAVAELSEQATGEDETGKAEDACE